MNKEKLNFSSLEEFVHRNKDVFRLPVRDLNRKLVTTLHNCEYSVRHRNTYTYAKGSIPVLLVAHMDTVFENEYQNSLSLFNASYSSSSLTPQSSFQKPIFHDHEANILWSPWGLGADDRAGVIGVLALLDCGYRPHVLFTDGEERGGIGATDFTNFAKGSPLDVDFVLELDREGCMEVVTYNDQNPQLEEHMRKYGFKKKRGVFTDICVLCPKLGISGANLSCGFFSQHTTHEVLVVPDLVQTIIAVGKVLEDAQSLPRKRYDYVSAPSAFKNVYYKEEAETKQRWLGIPKTKRGDGFVK